MPALETVEHMHKAMIDAVQPGVLVKIPMSRAEYLALGETHHTEYYDGTCVVNPPRRRHQRAEGRLFTLLSAHLPEGHEVFIEWGWESGPSFFRPDIMIVPIEGPEQIQSDPPFLAVEILSPSTRGEDRLVKRTHYLHGGLEWYWIVDIDDGTLTVLRRDGDGFGEVQVLTETGTTVGPIAVEIDLRRLADAPT